MKQIRFVISILVVFFYVSTAAFTLFGLPEGEQVESGSAAFERPDSSTLNVTAGDKAVINFNSFSIAQNENVNFIQPSSAASALARVIGPSPSEIFGSLNANGTLFLVNQNGIYFGPQAQVNVNSLIASTLDISTNNFINGNYVLQHNINSKFAYILNEGRITGSNIALIASGVHNKGVLIAKAGTVNLASGNKVAVSFDMRGFVQVEINEKTTGKVLDMNGNDVKDAIKNSGAIEATQVMMSAKTASDIFENAVNQKGIVKASGMVAENGVIRIISNNKIQLAGTLEAKVEVVSEAAVEVSGKLDVSGDLSIKAAGTIDFKGAVVTVSLEAETDSDINVFQDITATGSDIKMLADRDGDGSGKFTQAAGSVIYAQETGDVLIDGSEEMTLATVKTDAGAIKIGTIREPTSIAGEPHFIHTTGDIEITGVGTTDNITTLTTTSGDVLRYNTTGKVTLDAQNGQVRDLTNTPIPGSYLELIGNNFSIVSSAETTHIYENDGNLYISDASKVDDLITIRGDGFGTVSYIATKNLTLQTDFDLGTFPGMIIPGGTVTLIARQFGSTSTPVTIDAVTTHITRTIGDINIVESTGIGTSILITGPPEGFGQIIYPLNSNLILEAARGSLSISQNVSISAQNITLKAPEGTITSYGTMIANDGEGTIILKAYELHLGGSYVASYIDFDPTNIWVTTAINTTGDVTFTATNDIYVNANITTASGTLTFTADSDQDTNGSFIQASDTVITTTISGDINIYGASAIVDKLIAAGNVKIAKYGFMPEGMPGDITINDTITAGGDIYIYSNANVSVGANITAGTELYLYADYDGDGTGNLSFSNNPILQAGTSSTHAIQAANALTLSGTTITAGGNSATLSQGTSLTITSTGASGSISVTGAISETSIYPFIPMMGVLVFRQI